MAVPVKIVLGSLLNYELINVPNKVITIILKRTDVFLIKISALFD